MEIEMERGGDRERKMERGRWGDGERVMSKINKKYY